MRKAHLVDGPVVGEALSVARRMQGLAIADLARLSGVTRQQISHIESSSGVRSAQETVDALAHALDVPTAFLMHQPKPPPPSRVLHFRQKRRPPDHVVDQALACASVWSGVVDGLRERCGTLPSDHFALPNDGLGMSIEDAALALRRKWGLTDDAPVGNVTRLIERAGGFVGLLKNADIPVDAFCWTDRTAGALVLCNLDRHGPSRLRFSLMHEAAHLVLHRNYDAGDADHETIANRFASAFLLPRRPFWQEFPRRGTRLNWSGMMRMKQRWGVSIQALVVRAHDLGLIDPTQYRAAFARIQQNGWKNAEPEELPAFEMPELPVRIVEALSAKGIGADVLSGEMSMDTKMLGALVGSDVSRFSSARPGVVVAFAPRRPR